ncbi:MAG TPA: cupin domain-containing protein [Blastocatellia bacterium]|nr:cupin domain-containing protein [Blastocatellia bacterium]
MALTRIFWLSAILIATCYSTALEAQAQATGKDNHGHLTDKGGVCVDLQPGEKMEGFGCWNIAGREVKEFPAGPLFWHLNKFPTREAAEASRGKTDLVVEAEGQVWLFSFGLRDAVPGRGEHVATIGPLQMVPAKSYGIVVSLAVLPPGAKSVVHVHPGPEAWYMLAGEQCLETPAGTGRAKAGETLTAPPNTPMRLTITGSTVRHSLVVVIHDSSRPRSIPTSEWKPAGTCDR